MTRPPPLSRPANQQGVFLIVVLVLLTVATMLGLSTYRISTNGEKSARNDRDYQLAWQSSEAALLDAQFDIEGPGTSKRQSSFKKASKLDFAEGCGAPGSKTEGLCLPSTTDIPTWLSVDMADSASSATTFGQFTERSFDAGATGVRPWSKPQYIIEVLPDAPLFSDKSIDAPKNVVYRVTALGFGPREEVQAVMQMIFRKE